ncbi:hypothetical protein GCM10022217_36210 [Chryseobacterium ginsenosidimutans]|uniref:hypothetical protein n=1 Tax=Chryseobacterium ginsenosidimutans TaxID=687846 RepID=UPI0031E05ADF
MNTTKNTIEYQIKKQISEREIAPSRDLWSEIETQSWDKSSKTKINWFLVAACLVLAFSLGVVLVFNKENNDIVKPKIAKANNPKTQQNIKTTTAKSPVLIEQNQKESVAIENISPEEKIETTNSPIIAEKKLPLMKENASEIASNIPQIPAEKIIAQGDSAKSPVKRKRYVDPSTLLFSVEHKDVIEKTKQSNVATIDLNGK